MNRFILVFVIYTLVYCKVNANNINITNVSIGGHNIALGYTLLQFDISWENSWHTSTLESNWDAAWVFAKYRLQGSSTWNHISLNASGHTAPVGATIDAPADGKGAFIYKSTNSIGNNTFTSAKLRWNYSTDGLVFDNNVEVCVYALEMIYVPSGNFYLGDGTTTTLQGQFESDTTSNTFQVTSEAAITLGGGSSASLGNNNSTGMSVLDDFNNTSSQTLPSAFPKGYNAYYIMKYEITQEQYVEFLNKLTYTQQVTRTATAPNSAVGTGALSSINATRNGIDIMTPGVSTTTPAIYACNLNANTTYNETNDGQNIGCSFLSWSDFAAYIDWSGLRPMTEFEFEKACRGVNIAPVANEYAWGSTTITGATGIANSGLINEMPSNAGSNCIYNNVAAVQGPMRVGSCSQSGTNRQNSGGSYYGIMDLSGNLWERTITVGNATGRAYTGVNGDGSIDATGNANVANWPTTTAVGAGVRGSHWNRPGSFQRVSDRFEAASTFTSRNSRYGGRGVRTAP